MNAVSAGTIASSNGSATAAPMPRSTVRREMDFLVTIMIAISSLFAAGLQPRLGCAFAALRGSALVGLSICLARRMVNGVLFTIARIIDDQR